ncbi:P-loop containing nucleoside triphosphate hydrolase protein [Pelagophyceae sp. CCMP2097]|nr:P-loop containing nucleoside triphosphate hydrolase protein [Pelagophyceae sp. CCMP2097]
MAPRASRGDAASAALPTPKRAKPDAPLRIKVLSMGCRFVSKYISTVGVDYGVKPVMIDGRTVRINFWDLSGRPEFFEIRNEFYKDTQGALLVFDVSERSSFESLNDWLAEASKFGMARDLPVVVCANKIDKPRKVSEDEGRAWAARHRFEYFEASASSGASVNDLFDALFKLALDRVGASA